MTERRDDLEASLADIDRKLRDLQSELQVVARHEEPLPPPPPEPSPPPPPEPSPPPPPEPSPPPPPPPPRADAVEDRLAELTRRVEDLARLSVELEDAARALQEELARGDSPTTWSGEVVVRVGPFRDIAALGDFERALTGIAGAEDAFVRSFAGDRALVELRLREATDLVGEMRRVVAGEVRVVDSGPAELEISLEP